MNDFRRLSTDNLASPCAPPHVAICQSLPTSLIDQRWRAALAAVSGELDLLAVDGCRGTRAFGQIDIAQVDVAVPARGYFRHVSRTMYRRLSPN